jgi:histidinol dehydrogenase
MDGAALAHTAAVAINSLAGKRNLILTSCVDLISPERPPQFTGLLFGDEWSLNVQPVGAIATPDQDRSMPLSLDAKSHRFEADFRALLSQKREVSEEVTEVAKSIIHDVRISGDAALSAFSAKYDRVDLTTLGIRIANNDIEAAIKDCDPAAMSALQVAKHRIEAYHLRQRPMDQHFADDIGVELGWRWTALESVGLYVPGGSASYPSSVLMNAIPAKVAGVPRIVMVVPAPGGVINPLVLAAASLAGVDEIYRVGGAQAIAALAYGTQSMAPVVKIVGPGNAYVAAAKRLVFGQVGIDMIAGPSEVVILADDTANPAWIAADLLAQAEHDTASQSILITDSPALAADVQSAVESQLKTLPRSSIAGASWRDFGAVITVGTLTDAIPLVDRLAPEHLEIMTRDDESLAVAIRNAGAIFLGGHTPEAIGDYVGGSNHVLPTARSARYASGLGVLDFMKRTSILKCGADQLRVLGPSAIALGKAEGLDAHARSVAIRLNLPLD